MKQRERVYSLTSVKKNTESYRVSLGLNSFESQKRGGFLTDLACGREADPRHVPVDLFLVAEVELERAEHDD